MSEERGYAMGINCLEELLRFAPKHIIKVYVARQNKREERKLNFLQALQSRGIVIKEVESDFLTSLAGSDSHQGFVAEVRRNFVDLKAFIAKSAEKTKSLVLVLDSIFDPQNLGAILRVGECFQVDGVLFSKNRGSDVTAVVSKASSGASELLPLIKVSNLAESVRAFKEEGFTAIVADLDQGAQELYSFTFPDKSLLILGSEGKGVQMLLKKMADVVVKIPLLGKIDSLNVAQTCAIFLYHFRNKSSKP